MLRGRRSRFAAALAALLATLAGCATNPVTGKRQFSLVTQAQELELGSEGNKAVLEEYGAYDDPGLQAYVDSVGHALARVSHRPDLEWHFTIVDDPAVNAFALPGGYIFVTRGILAHLGSEAQLAGVIGHEIGHVTARHSAQQMTQQQLAGLGLGLASMVSPAFQRYGGVAQQALGLLFLKYSRADETQADELGVEYSTKAGWDSRQMPLTYEMLGRVSVRSGQRLPTFLATHPDPGDREAHTRALAAKETQGRTGLLIRERSYLGHVNGIVYGDDPRTGYFEGDQFYHPGLGFQMRFPAGWQTQNQRSALLAQEPQQRAAMQLTVEKTGGESPAAFVDQLAASGKILGARGAPETVGGFPAWAGRLAVRNQDGSQGSLVAAFIQRPGGETFQVLGRGTAPGDAYEAMILESARAFRSLSDPARRNPRPARVELVTVSRTEPLRQVIAKLGEQGIDPEGTSILNNVQLDEDVLKGQPIKIVRPGSRR